MSYRGFGLLVVGLCAGIGAANAQPAPACPLAVGSSSITITCAQGTPFYVDLSGRLATLAGEFGSLGVTFTYTITLTSGSLPPGISLSPTGVLSGTFTASGDFSVTETNTIMLSADGGAPFSASASTPIEFIVTGYSGPALTLDPSALSFSLTQKGAPGTQSLTLTNHNAQALQISTSAATNAGGNWLTVAPTTSVPAFASLPLTIMADPSQLAAGTYSGTVTISTTGAPSSTVSVLAVVTGGQPNLVLSQTGLFYDAVTGGTASPPQTITVLDSGTGTLNFAASATTVSGGDWLSVTPGSGSTSASTPGSVTVSVNPIGLQPGTYYGKVVISASGAADSPQFASVVVNVVAPANSPGASVSPTGFVFIGSAGGTNPAAQTVSITNPSPDALSFLVTPIATGSASWLSATPSSGSVSATQPATLSVQASLQGLAAGIYSGVVTVTIPPATPSATSLGQVLQLEALLIVLPSGESPAVRSGPQPRASTCTPTQLLPVFTLLGSGFSVAAGWPTAIAVTVVDDCGNPLLAGSVNVAFSSGDPALSLTSIGGGTWTGTWNATNAGANVTITAQAQELKPALTGHASIGGALQPNNAVPTVATGGIVSAANFLANQPLAPGSFGAIFGSNLSSGLIGSTQYPLSLQLGETSVVLAGEQLPLLFASGGQINMVVPYDVQVNSTQQLVVQTGTAISVPQSVVIAPASPAILTQNQAGTGAAIVQGFKPDATPLPLNSAVSAGDVIVLYCSGLGAVNPKVAAGSAAPLSPLSNTVNDVIVTIGGKQQKAAFAGLTPTYAQLYQVNVTIPSGLPSGSATVTLTVAGQQSAPVTIAIQ